MGTTTSITIDATKSILPKYNVTGASLSGYHSFNSNPPNISENEIISKYEKALEINMQIKKLTVYAKKNNLDVLKTIDSFFNAEELALHKQIKQLAKSVEHIKKFREKLAEQEKQILDNWMQNPNDQKYECVANNL